MRPRAKPLEIASVKRSISVSKYAFAINVARNAARTSPHKVQWPPRPLSQATRPRRPPPLSKLAMSSRSDSLFVIRTKREHRVNGVLWVGGNAN
jgi:hypothetical protein